MVCSKNIWCIIRCKLSITCTCAIARSKQGLETFQARNMKKWQACITPNAAMHRFSRLFRLIHNSCKLFTYSGGNAASPHEHQSHKLIESLQLCLHVPFIPMDMAHTSSIKLRHGERGGNSTCIMMPLLSLSLSNPLTSSSYKTFSQWPLQQQNAFLLKGTSAAQKHAYRSNTEKACLWHLILHGMLYKQPTWTQWNVVCVFTSQLWGSVIHVWRVLPSDKK